MCGTFEMKQLINLGFGSKKVCHSNDGMRMSHMAVFLVECTSGNGYVASLQKICSLSWTRYLVEVAAALLLMFFFGKEVSL